MQGPKSVSFHQPVKFEKIYLELTAKDFRSPPAEHTRTVMPSLELIEKPPYELYRKWHDDVGRPFSWHTRPRINDRTKIEALLNQPGVEMILLRNNGVAVGYSLTEREPDGAVEISDFGFLPKLTGKGLGTVFFPLIVQRLIDSGATRIWLSTRSTNHPKVSEFYQRFGFKEYKRESVTE